MSNAILVIEDEANLAKNIKRYMERSAYEVRTVADGEQGLKQLEQFKPDIILLDFHLPGKDGLEVLRGIRQLDTQVKIILITGHGNTQLAVDAIKAGADDYLSKPLVLSELKMLIDKSIGEQQLEGTLSYYRRREASKSGLSKIIGESPAIVQCKEQVARLIEAERSLRDGETPPVLITGDTGTGKELVARALHFDGRRREQPFVEINCASIPNHLIESEMFGYERGAFTDARSRKIGLIESAERGTLFLDEIGDLDLSLQAKFLKVLEDKTIRRIGSVRERRVDVRIIAATNQNLDELVSNGKFRHDLFYRLSVVSLHVPRLKERGNDIHLLAEHFLQVQATRYGKTGLEFSARARNELLHHNWPGNVRELRNVIEQAVLMTSGNEIKSGILPCHPALAEAEVREITDRHNVARVFAAFGEGNFKMDDVESALIAQALENSAGNVTQAAKLLGITRDTLRYRMEKYNIQSTAGVAGVGSEH